MTQNKSRHWYQNTSNKTRINWPLRLQAEFPMIRAMALELRSQSMVVLGPMMPNLSRSRNIWPQRPQWREFWHLICKSAVKAQEWDAIGSNGLRRNFTIRHYPLSGKMFGTQFLWAVDSDATSEQSENFRAPSFEGGPSLLSGRPSSRKWQ